jgi:hypothetical protein
MNSNIPTRQRCSSMLLDLRAVTRAMRVYKKRFRVLLVPLVSAVIQCGGPSDPQYTPGPGPSLLITNKLVGNRVYVTWTDAAGQILTSDSVGPRVSKRCVRLQPVVSDSAQWTVRATESNEGTPLTSSVVSYWYHVGDRRAFEVLVFSATAQSQSPTIQAWDSASAANGPVYGQTREVPPHC